VLGASALRARGVLSTPRGDEHVGGDVSAWAWLGLGIHLVLAWVLVLLAGSSLCAGTVGEFAVLLLASRASGEPITRDHVQCAVPATWV
jgi:hypothetical protein